MFEYLTSALFPSLRVLKCSECDFQAALDERFTMTDMVRLMSNFLHRLPLQLQVLEIDIMIGLSFDIAQAICRLQQLKILSLSCSQSDLDQLVRAANASGLSCFRTIVFWSLRSLVLSVDIEDDGFVLILKAVPNLVALSLGSCPRLTATALYACGIFCPMLLQLHVYRLQQLDFSKWGLSTSKKRLSRLLSTYYQQDDGVDAFSDTKTYQLPLRLLNFSLAGDRSVRLRSILSLVSLLQVT